MACLAGVSLSAALSGGWLLASLLVSALAGELLLAPSLQEDGLFFLIGSLGTVMVIPCNFYVALSCAIGRVCCAVVAKWACVANRIFYFLSSSV